MLGKLLKMYNEAKSSSPQAGVAVALQSCAFSLSEGDISLALNFLLEDGIKNDDPDVRGSMIDAGMTYFCFLS